VWDKKRKYLSRNVEKERGGNTHSKTHPSNEHHSRSRPEKRTSLKKGGKGSKTGDRGKTGHNVGGRTLQKRVLAGLRGGVRGGKNTRAKTMPREGLWWRRGSSQKLGVGGELS